jgi:hypothetical protein
MRLEGSSPDGPEHAMKTFLHTRPVWTRALRVHRIPANRIINKKDRSGGLVSRRAGTRDETFVHNRPVWTRALRIASLPNIPIKDRLEELLAT